MPRDNIEAPLPTIVKTEHSSHCPTMMMNTFRTRAENGSCHGADDDDDDDTTSQPGTLVIHEDVELDRDRFCGRSCGNCCCGVTLSSRSKKESMTFWCLAVVTVLIMAAGTLTAVLLRTSISRTNTTNTSPQSPASTNILRTESYYQERYELFSGILITTFDKNGAGLWSTQLTTPDTPQYHALQWLVYDDTTIASHAADSAVVVAVDASVPSYITSLLQRYIIMVLYYACGGEGWQMGSASSTTATTTTTTPAGNIEALGHIDTCEWGDALQDPNFIVCDPTTGRKEIVTLQLDQKRLIGQLPNELFVLSSLVTLDVSYNFLKGTIPSDLFHQMIHLRTYSRRK